MSLGISRNWQLLLCTLLALGVRLWFLEYRYPHWGLKMTRAEEARSILNGEGHSIPLKDKGGKTWYMPSAYDMPGYPCLLALSWRLFGVGDLVPIQTFQILVDSMFCLLVYQLAIRLRRSRAVALISAFLYAIYPPIATLSVTPQRDVWSAWAVILCAWFYLRHLEEGRFLNLVGAGLILGVGAYFRPTIIHLPFFLGACSLFWGVRVRGAILKTVCLYSLIFLFLFPWAFRNRVIYDRWIWTRTSLYLTFWDGLAEFPNPYGAVASDELTTEQLKKEGYPLADNSTLEFEERMKKKVMAALKQDPLWYVGSIFRRVPRVLVVNRIPWGVWQDDTLSYHRHYATRNSEKSVLEYARILLDKNPGFLFTKFLDVLLLVLAGLGLFWGRGQSGPSAFLLTFPVYFMVIHLPIHIEGRYLVPMHWAYLILSSFALHRIGALIRSQEPASEQRLQMEKLSMEA